MNMLAAASLRPRLSVSKIIDLAVAYCLPSRRRSRWRVRAARRLEAGRASTWTHAPWPVPRAVPAPIRARSGSESCLAFSGSASVRASTSRPPATASPGAGGGSGETGRGRATARAPGQAASIARSTMRGGTCPGTHIRIASSRPVKTYSNATCGCPWMSRARRGRCSPSRLLQSVTAPAGEDSGGHAISSTRAPVSSWFFLWRRIRVTAAVTAYARTAAVVEIWGQSRAASTSAARSADVSHPVGAITVKVSMCWCIALFPCRSGCPVQMPVCRNGSSSGVAITARAVRPVRVRWRA